MVESPKGAAPRDSVWSRSDGMSTVGTGVGDQSGPKATVICGRGHGTRSGESTREEDDRETLNHDQQHAAWRRLRRLFFGVSEWRCAP